MIVSILLSVEEPAVVLFAPFQRNKILVIQLFVIVMPTDFDEIKYSGIVSYETDQMFKLEGHIENCFKNHTAVDQKHYFLLFEEPILFCLLDSVLKDGMLTHKIS